MKTLFLDCSMGAAGDMLSAALLDAVSTALSPEQVTQSLNAMSVPDVVYTAEETERGGIRGIRLHVAVHGTEEGEHASEHAPHSRTLQEIWDIIDSLTVDTETAARIRAVYERLADAESHAHGIPVTEVHLHEVGMLDAIADIAAFSNLFGKIRPDRVIASPVRTGYGTVQAAHGILPVPAPATAYLLQDVPCFAGDIEGEMCTPTGAAILTSFADEFRTMPVMRVERIGYGCGTKEFPTANCVRAMIGETDPDRPMAVATVKSDEEIVKLEADIDDMTGEEIGFAINEIYEAGAIEVYQTQILMKKGRPGVLLTVLLHPEKRDAVVQAVFRYTTTIGIREAVMQRYVLNRKTAEELTDYGPIHRKISDGYGVHREKWEYEDLAALAREEGIGLRDIREKLGK